MTDADWGDLDQIPVKKGGSKLLFCGLGCMIPLVLLVFGAFWLKGWVEDARDSELQWENLRELVEYDYRPEGWEMELGIQSGWLDAKMFILTSTDGLSRTITFLQVPHESLREMFDTDNEDVVPWNPPETEEPLEFLEVQGRQLRVVHLDHGQVESSDSEGTAEVEVTYGGPAVALDLTPEGSSTPIVLTFAHSEDHVLTPDEILGFLAPFHVGSDR